tara:strand:- start:1839 stop:2678 length:840 start_codon:yes stop_codon:yes gene_type:complete
MILILVKNEFKKVLKRKRTYISFLLIGILIPFIVGAISNGGTTLEKSIYGQLSDSFFFIGSLLNGYLATYIIIAVLINHMPFLSTIIASDIFSGEYSRSTFRMYLTRPISRTQVLVSKVIVVLAYTSALMGFFFLYALLISISWLGTGELAVFHKGILFLSSDEVMQRFALAFLISNYVMLTISLLCLLISAISKNSVTPIIITISIVFIGTAITYIPIELFKVINPYLFTGYINSFLKAFHDPIPWSHIGSLLITCTVWSALFVSLSLFFFNKKDITD